MARFRYSAISAGSREARPEEEAASHPLSSSSVGTEMMG
jgi:hypothetical protein